MQWGPIFQIFSCKWAVHVILEASKTKKKLIRKRKTRQRSVSLPLPRSKFLFFFSWYRIWASTAKHKLHSPEVSCFLRVRLTSQLSPFTSFTFCARSIFRPSINISFVRANSQSRLSSECRLFSVLYIDRKSGCEFLHYFTTTESVSMSVLHLRVLLPLHYVTHA